MPAGAVCPPAGAPPGGVGGGGALGTVDTSAIFNGMKDQMMTQFGGIVKVGLIIGVPLFALSKGWELYKHLVAPDLGSEDDEDDAYAMNRTYDSQERSARVRELRNM